MHENRFYSLDGENHLHDLMLSKAVDFSDRVITLSYPNVPFFDLNFVLALHFIDTSNLGEQDDDIFSISGRTATFFPMRYLPGHPKYISYRVSGRNRDFLTPMMLIIQNWMRRISRRRLRARHLALAMGMHSRLGSLSPLFVLEADLFKHLVTQQSMLLL